MESTDRKKAGSESCDEISASTYRRLHPQLYAQIRRMGVPAVDVEDLIQETFLNAQKALDDGTFEGRSKLDTWIVSIAKLASLKYHRRLRAAKRKAKLVPLQEESTPAGHLGTSIPASREPSPQATASSRQQVAHTLRALQRLPESYREPLVLSVRGFTYDQIAAVLQIPVTRVTSRIHQARAKLLKSLSGFSKGS